MDDALGDLGIAPFPAVSDSRRRGNASTPLGREARADGHARTRPLAQMTQEARPLTGRIPHGVRSRLAVAALQTPAQRRRRPRAALGAHAPDHRDLLLSSLGHPTSAVDSLVCADSAHAAEWSPPVAPTWSSPSLAGTQVAASAERPHRRASERERRQREAVTISTSPAPPCAAACGQTRQCVRRGGPPALPESGGEP